MWPQLGKNVTIITTTIKVKQDYSMQWQCQSSFLCILWSLVREKHWWMSAGLLDAQKIVIYLSLDLGCMRICQPSGKKFCLKVLEPESTEGSICCLIMGFSGFTCLTVFSIKLFPKLLKITFLVHNGTNWLGVTWVGVVSTYLGCITFYVSHWCVNVR